MTWKNNFPKDNIYFETDKGILYHGDSLEILKQFPNNSIDLVLTDPTYIINYKTNRRKNKQHEFSSVIQNDDNIEIIFQIIPIFYDILMKGGHYGLKRKKSEICL